MSDIREVFTVLEDASGAGVSWEHKHQGDAIVDVNLAPVVTGVDKDGNFSLLPLEIEGEAIGNAIPVLAGKDENGDLAFIPIYNGGVVVSDDKKGTALHGVATVTAVLNTMTLVTEISLTATKISKEIVAIVSNTFATLWELTSVDNAVETTLARWLTGPGMFTFRFSDENLLVTAGATAPKLRISGKQFVGAASDMHASLSCYQLD